MDLIQTIAFLQWLTDGQPFDTWHKEGLLDQRAWIEANGFDPAIVLAGIEGLEQRNLLPSGFEDLLSGALILDAKNSWIKAAQELLIRQKSLMELAGGAGSTLKEFRLSYQKSLNNINKHTDREIEKEIEGKIERQIEHQIVEGLNKEFPKYTDEWSIGATAAKQDYKEKTINENQKSFLTAHGITINKISYYNAYNGTTTGFQLNFKHGGYIYIDKDTSGGELNGGELQAELGAQRAYQFTWNENPSEERYYEGNCWLIFSQYISLRDLNKKQTYAWNEQGNPETRPAIWNLFQATSVLQKEERLATKVNKTIESPYVKLALKYDLGDKRYSNLASVYDVLKYIQKAKFEDFSVANMIKFTLAMMELEYDLVTKKFSKYQRLWLTSKHIYEALDTPDKIYQKSFALWWIRGYIKQDDIRVYNDSYDSAKGEETDVQIDVTNKKTGQTDFINAEVGPTGNEVIVSHNGWKWKYLKQTDFGGFGYSKDHIKKQGYEEEKQSQIFQQLQKSWTKEQILHNNFERTVGNPVLNRILHHEVRRYANDHKYYQVNKVYIDNQLSYIQTQWQKESKNIPWLNLITKQSSFLLLRRVNNVDFKALKTRQKVSLLCDLYYTQNKFKHYKGKIDAFYCGFNRYIHMVGRWLDEINKISTELVSIAWRQIVAGTYRIHASNLPIYSQLINRLVIESLEKQNPRISYKSNSEIVVQGNDGALQIWKTQVVVGSDNNLQYKNAINFQIFNDEDYRISYFDYFYTDYNVHQFALNWERKWFASTQEQWAKQAYNQIRIFDIWYRQLTCFPLMAEILRHDLLHSKDWNKAINNGVLQYLHKNKILKGLPSLGKINQTLLLLEEIDINGITREQKRWLHRQSKILQLSVFLDIVALRTTVAVFSRRHRSLIKQLNNAAQTLEKVTPDRFYQHSINTYIYSQLKAGNLEYNHYYKIPDTEDQVEILKEENSNGNLYDVVISLPNAPAGTRGYTNVDVSKTSNGWVANYIEQDKVFYLNNINIDQVDFDILKRWRNSEQEKVAIDEWGQIALFYEHTKWLFSLAYIPGILKRQSSKRFKQYDKYNWVVDNAAKLTRDSNYFFNLDFRRLSTRKKVMMISDYALFATYKLPSLEQRVGEHRKEEGKAPIAEVYRRLNRLAKVYVQITFAEIYQHEFDYVFNVPKWKRTLNRPHDIIISKEYNTSTDSEYYNIEIYNDKGAKDLIATKQQVGWDVEGLNFFAYGDISRGGNFNFYYTTVLDPIRQLTISGQWKGSISINTNKQAINIPSFRSLKELKKEYQSLKYLSGFVKNTVINSVAHKYIRRHHKIDQIVKWLPSTKKLEYTIAEARKINFKAHKEGKKILILDYYRAAYSISKHYQHLSTHLSTQEKGFLSQDNRLLLELTSILKSHKIVPGTHGKIDQWFEHYKTSGILPNAIASIQKYIYGIKHPKAHKRPWKQWKTWNERVDSLINLTRVSGIIAEAENEFYTIEKNALTAAYKTYQTDLLIKNDSKQISLKYADRAYVASLISQDQALWGSYLKFVSRINNAPYKVEYDFWYLDFKVKTPKGWSEEQTVNFADAKVEKIAEDSIEEIYCREILSARKLFHIQNDKYARELRLDKYLLIQIAADKVAANYIGHYKSLIAKERSSLKRGHLYHFFVDLGLAAWDLVKTPYTIVATTWKDLINGVGFFKSWDDGLEAGFKNIKKSINYLAEDVKDLFFLVDGLLLDIEWLGKETIFRWCRNVSWIKKIDGGMKHAIFDVEMGAVLIGKSILEMPLTLAKDVNDIGKGLVAWGEGKITFKQMLANDLEPLVHTINRLAKFVDHIFTHPKTIIKKIGDIKTLLHFMKLKHEVKIVRRFEKIDRHTRKRLHHQTFGIIQSPFEKFKQRNEGLYYKLKLTNKQYINTGYFTSHLDASIAERQLDAIYKAQIKLNKISNKSDLQQAEQQLTNQFNIDKDKLTVQKQAIDADKFMADSNEVKSKLFEKFVVKDFESYFNISSANLQRIEKEDKKGLHLFIKKEGKLHLTSIVVNLFENWMNTVIKRQRKYVHAYAQLYTNHPKFASAILELDCLSAFYADVKKEQTIINSDWASWGRNDGKMLFDALTTYFLPGFNIKKDPSELFGLNLSFTVLGSNGKFMSVKQINKIKTYDNAHHIGEKIFDMILWTYFLDQHKITKIPTLNWFTHKNLSPLSPFLPYTEIVNKKINNSNRHNTIKRYEKYYHGSLKTYAVYSKRLKSINRLLDLQIESLSEINSALKKFEGMIDVSGFYKQLFQQILIFDYTQKSYSNWMNSMKKHHSKQLDYLEHDKYVLSHDVELGDTVTVGDVLMTFTPEGQLNINQTYNKLNDIVTPPTPGPTPAPPKPKQEIKRIDREIRVNPIRVFKNYEVIKHISKVFKEKSLKQDAAKLKSESIAEAEAKVEAKEATLIEREADTVLIEFDNTIIASENYIESAVEDACAGIEIELDNTVTDIEADLNILEDV